jgi:hypothetical protein
MIESKFSGLASPARVSLAALALCAAPFASGPAAAQAAAHHGHHPSNPQGHVHPGGLWRYWPYGYGWPYGYSWAAGSTPQGDIARGFGEYAKGLGEYNLDTAKADAINAGTAIELNQYSFLSQQEANRRYALRRQRQLGVHEAAYDSGQQRVRENPTPSDIESGNALNALARDLTGPAFGPSALRLAVVPVPAGAAAEAPLSKPRAGLTVAPRRLEAGGPWPAPLHGPAFAAAREGYHRAVDAALEGAARGALTPHDAAAVDRALADLRRGLAAAAGAAPGDEVGCA